ncbi:murein DD-endopeptidase MepM/ murein hydrolase activator NlpD [Kribbella voronezhensis]|uniref:Murein DD-endopeptidase MepM/ murein hydrolase activator NlpD n=1 Tax=Kribbella voronezhensis TaxID=2512212 RepID=A0A4V3FK01_9ACTN|nr:M23 family metallopeptidase [Kribbella voronezhensis]TDU88293.1 murein DD-endopeptidase MepM/ murein hydrolase activator NlpD [Kribbella voronezhensis]
MVPHFPGANPRKRGSIKRDDSIGATVVPDGRFLRRRLGGPPGRQTVIAACCVVLSLSAGVLAAVPAAQADPPDPAAKKKQLDSQIQTQRGELNEASDQLAKSVAAYSQAEAQYQAVQVKYAAAQGKLAAAKAADLVAASKLKAAELALQTAMDEVTAGEQLLDAKKAVAGRAVRSAYQQQNSLVGLSIVLRGASPADLATGMQVQRNVFGIQGNAITNLNNAQAQLANKRVKVQAAEQAVAAQRAEAARTVKEVTALTLQVAADKAEAAKVAATRLTAQQAAEKEKNTELAQYNALVSERTRVEQILIARARAEKAAAARRKAAREAAERAKAKKEHRPPRNIPDDPGSSSGLSFPIDTYITSPYGMRFHPILHVWKLHDGTDFGAGCGTPIHAAASGVVTDRYYNGGYGNRLFLSNGVMRGSSITTVYNHLSRYKVRVGQHVSKGQVIGYVGTTGYSTGCHLHFMVYQDGRVVNPMKWL